MTESLSWFARSPIAAFLRVFVSVALGLAVISLSEDGLSGALADWQTWVVAGLVSAVPVLIRWLNPQDPAFGRNAS